MIYSIKYGPTLPARKEEILKMTLQCNIADGPGASDEERRKNTVLSHRRSSTLVGHRKKQNPGCVVSNIGDWSNRYATLAFGEAIRLLIRNRRLEMVSDGHTEPVGRTVILASKRSDRFS